MMMVPSEINYLPNLPACSLNITATFVVLHAVRLITLCVVNE